MRGNCPLCPASSLRPFLRGVRDHEYGVAGEFAFSRCPRCRLLVLQPQPTLEQLKTYYPPDYHGFHTAGGGIVSGLYRVVHELRFREILRLAGPTGRLLDVGCADAPYFDLLRERHPGLDCVGLEFKEEIAALGRSRGRKIVTGTLADFPDPGPFDLVIMNNLIEHVLDPIDEMRRAGALLRAGGHILLETPNLASGDFLLSRRFWGGLHAPRHTFLFSPGSLRLLAERTGFEMVDCACLLNTDHWGLSVQNFLQSHPLTRTALRRGRAWYYPFLLFAFIPLNLVQMLMGFAGAIKATFRKKSG